MAEPARTEPALDPGRIAIILNPGSGRNTHDREAANAAIDVLQPAEVIELTEDADMADLVARAVDARCGTIVAAGGDGTIRGVAGAMAGGGARMAVLPFGTFNFFARGLGLPTEPEEAARAILTGRSQNFSLGEIEGKLFLNNVSLGIYPAILRAREDVYRRFGRRRIAAYWSTLRTFWQFQRPMRLTIEANGETLTRRTPLVFVARSAFQLEHYGLQGVEDVEAGRFAVFIAPDHGRIGLFREAWRLVTRQMEAGRDFEYIGTEALTITTSRNRVLVACDGEKLRLSSPLSLRMRKDALQVVVPDV